MIAIASRRNSFGYAKKSYNNEDDFYSNFPVTNCAELTLKTKSISKFNHIFLYGNYDFNIDTSNIDYIRYYVYANNINNIPIFATSATVSGGLITLVVSSNVASCFSVGDYAVLEQNSFFNPPSNEGLRAYFNKPFPVTAKTTSSITLTSSSNYGDVTSTNTFNLYKVLYNLGLSSTSSEFSLGYTDSTDTISEWYHRVECFNVPSNLTLNYYNSMGVFYSGGKPVIAVDNYVTNYQVGSLLISNSVMIQASTQITSVSTTNYRDFTVVVTGSSVIENFAVGDKIYFQGFEALKYEELNYKTFIIKSKATNSFVFCTSSTNNSVAFQDIYVNTSTSPTAGYIYKCYTITQIVGDGSNSNSVTLYPTLSESIDWIPFNVIKPIIIENYISGYSYSFNNPKTGLSFTYKDSSFIKEFGNNSVFLFKKKKRKVFSGEMTGLKADVISFVEFYELQGVVPFGIKMTSDIDGINDTLIGYFSAPIRVSYDTTQANVMTASFEITQI